MGKTLRHRKVLSQNAWCVTYDNHAIMARYACRQSSTVVWRNGKKEVLFFATLWQTSQLSTSIKHKNYGWVSVRVYVNSVCNEYIAYVCTSYTIPAFFAGPCSNIVCTEREGVGEWGTESPGASSFCVSPSDWRGVLTVLLGGGERERWVGKRASRQHISTVSQSLASFFSTILRRKNGSLSHILARS